MLPIQSDVYMYYLVDKTISISKHRALSRKVKVYFRLYLAIGWTSVEPNLKHLILKLPVSTHRGLYTTAYGWNRPLLNAQCLPIYRLPWSNFGRLPTNLITFARACMVE